MNHSHGRDHDHGSLGARGGEDEAAPMAPQPNLDMATILAKLQVL
jgi:hypothetical protein